ncbi:MAG: NACHT domain-containing protein [Desulfobulbia bacterium]
MEWFHFSDFHIGKPKGPQASAMASLIEAVKLATSTYSIDKIDSVFITGDIAFSGKPAEYERFRCEFLSPLRELSAFSDAMVFAVPGNHDVDCDAALPIAWETIGKRNQEVFFCEDDDGAKIRSQRSVVFDAYWDFAQNNKIISPDPSKEVSLLRTEESYPFDILATNTAFFSDRDNDSDGETTPSPIESLNQRLRTRASEKPILILAHHPLTCILRTQQTALLTLLREKKAVLLHGHEHSPRVSFNQDGSIRTFGFGASYLASQGDQTSSPYLNTFSHCRLNNDGLYVRSYSWQSNPGKWLNTTALQLPDCMPDNDFVSEEAKLIFPYRSDPEREKNQGVAIRSIQRVAPKPKQLILIEPPAEPMIMRLFNVSANLRSIFQKGTPHIRREDFEDGRVRFELELENGQRKLLIFIYALNHVLSSKEVETINTELDTEGFSSATVISIGKISTDAKAMYLRLQDRKPIEIIVNEGIANETNSLLTDPQRLVLSSLDAAKQSVCLLLGKENLYLLIIDESDQQSKFYIISAEGIRLNPTDAIVAQLRKVNPDFAVMPYAGETVSGCNSKDNEFDEDQYLTQCYREYNVMKYAALANVGIRFSDLPLEELYINASASDVSDQKAMRFEQIVSDHVAAYPVSGELREHIQQQLLAQVRDGERQESSRALEFCQQYSAVLITGDPGSGKTCFVKSEILAYCKRSLEKSSDNEESTNDWHSSHIPVMVALSEVAAEKDLEESGLLTVASRLIQRRGLHIGVDNILSLTLQGRLAFFFDGLDEVVSIEKRAQIVQLINELLLEHLPKGNRIVVTSRPAAVQVVNLLPALHKLELQGLTETEIRTLAGRLLALKLSATQNDILLDEGELGDTDNIVISQLIADCEKNPGVSRMAQNPLLLTLLIMIYANSGAPSAKRHLIYEEAIKTLASVRGREAGHQPISVQDLRERLGAIALSVYKKESGILPIRSEVADVVRVVMERQMGETVTTVEANSFIQRVAESTGLIALEARHGAEDGNAIVTFMHHSFLEYFAAIGLSRELELIESKDLVHEPRWREILTLLAGIIGENEDVSPIIKRFLNSGSSEHDVDAKLLLFAIDCALECEVPSESAQRLLSVSIKGCLEHGPGRLDSWVRAEIGNRLSQLLSVCGGTEFDGMLAGMIRQADEAVSAAAIDVAGYAYAKGHAVPSEILSAFEAACSRVEVAVQSAICAATSRAVALRTDAALQVIARCLNKSRRNQQAALDALTRVPSLASKYWDDIIKCIDDENLQISRLASIAAMHAGLNIGLISLNDERKDILIRALNNVAVVSTPDEYHNIELKKETLEHLLSSANRRDKILGIRLLPLSEGEASYVYETLIELVKNSDTPREELVAALIACRWSSNVLSLIKLDDLKVVANWLEKGTSDVRIAAVRLLGWYRKDTLAIDALLSGDFRLLDLEDYCQRINALSLAKVQVPRVKELFFKELNNYLNEKKKSGSDNLKRIGALFDASKRLGEDAPPILVTRIWELIDDYKVGIDLKRKALLCLPAISTPSRKNVIRFAKLFKKPRIDMEDELVQVPSLLAKKCRSSVDNVVASVGALSELRDILLEFHAKYSKREITEMNEYYVTELRSGIDDVTQIIVAFKDFICVSRPSEVQ